jgi:hypothetical protein
MTDTKPIHRIAIIGTGVIGASWTVFSSRLKLL